MTRLLLTLVFTTVGWGACTYTVASGGGTLVPPTPAALTRTLPGSGGLTVSFRVFADGGQSDRCDLLPADFQAAIFPGGSLGGVTYSDYIPLHLYEPGTYQSLGSIGLYCGANRVNNNRTYTDANCVLNMPASYQFNPSQASPRTVKLRMLGINWELIQLPGPAPFGGRIRVTLPARDPNSPCAGSGKSTEASFTENLARNFYAVMDRKWFFPNLYMRTGRTSYRSIDPVTGCPTYWEQEHFDGGGVRGEYRAIHDSQELAEASPDYFVHRVAFPATLGTNPVTIPIVWKNRGDGDFLSIAFDGTVVAELLGIDFEEGRLYFVEMDPALLRGKTGLFSFYLQSVGSPNARVAIVNGDTLQLQPDRRDVNRDDFITCLDVSRIRAAFGKRNGQPSFDANADVNQDNIVDVRDLVVITRTLPANTSCPAN